MVETLDPSCSVRASPRIILCAAAQLESLGAGCYWTSACPSGKESPDRAIAQVKSMTASRLAALRVLIPLSAASVGCAPSPALR
jgi:hypothetical protein